MATRDSAVPPAPSEQSVQPAPPPFSPEPARISIPAASRPESESVRSRGSMWFPTAVSWITVGLILLFTFLSASFAVRNSDFWLHLATGRLIAHGEYHFGVDPFAYTTQGIYWANHSWLYDLAVYLIYSALGGPWLVILKSLLLTILALVLLQVRRPRSGLGLPAACTALAILAMTPRLVLQPACLSYLFLAVTLWLLWKPHANLADANTGSRPADNQTKQYVALLLLFALWVNVDAWFLLGPLLVLLFCLGERLQTFLPGAAYARSWRTPLWLLPASFAVCLLNPHHYHAFALPVELSPWLYSAGLENDPRFHRLFVSPWELGVHWQPAAAISLAEGAYFLLVGLGLVSFVLNRKDLSAWRLIIWLCFGLLGALQLRTTPFFAIVAGPITALNLQDFLHRRAAALSQGSAREPGGWLAGRLALLATGLTLVLLAWPGWLQGFQRDERHVAFDVRPDQSLQRAAQTIADWRGRNQLRDTDHAFAFHPEVAHYCAWFCPEEKSFFDDRLSLFPNAAIEYENVCRALNPALNSFSRSQGMGAPKEKSADNWEAVLRDRGISLVILYDPDPRIVFPALRRLARDPAHWTLLRIDGKVLIFGWNESRGGAAADPFAELRFDPERLAFDGNTAEGNIPPAPGSGPGRVPAERDLWTRFTQEPPQRVWESSTAAMLIQYQADAALAQRERDRTGPWAAYAAGLACLSALPGDPLGIPSAFLLRGRYPTLFRTDAARLPAVPLLAVRSARRALAADPDDGNAYLSLGQAYMALQEQPGGRPLSDAFSPLGLLRVVQTITALKHALLLNPDLESVHETLARIYRDRGYIDVALDHRREELRITRRAGQRAGESADEFHNRVDMMALNVQNLEDFVQVRQEEFGRRTQDFSGAPLDKALLAVTLGLGRQALDDVLLQSNVVLFGTAGARLELTLYLMLGRAEEARASLDDEDMKATKIGLGTVDLPVTDPTYESEQYRLPSYDWLRVCQAAATGDYDQAASSLAEIRGLLHQEEQTDLRVLQRTAAIAVASEWGLPGRLEALVFKTSWHNVHTELAERYRDIMFLRAEQADLFVVAGILALEQGQPAEAKRQFENALAVCPPDAVPPVEFAGRCLAEAQLRRFRTDAK